MFDHHTYNTDVEVAQNEGSPDPLKGDKPQFVAQ